MKSTTSARPADPAASTSSNSTARARVSLPRLYLLRLGYLVVAVGLALTKWPLIINHDRPWPLMEGVETCMLVALSLLSFLGLRYPLRLLPVLLFELAWKVIWLSVVALPLWLSHQLDPATLSVFYSCLVVLIVAAVIPWRYVARQYAITQGDPWRTAVPDVESNVPGSLPASAGRRAAV
jgi:hypothetical protein